jgi:hypothetical protein
MALLDAKEYDPRPRQRLMRLIGAAVVVAILAIVGWFIFRYKPEKDVINNFFQAIEAKNFEQAYGIYNADPDWKQHPQKYNNYTYNQFLLDWGPSGEYGAITSHKIECATEPKKRGFQSPSGVIVVVRINNRGDKTESFWVEKKSKTIGYPSPDKVYCGGSNT